MISAKDSSSDNHFLDLSLKQTNLLNIKDFLRFTNTYNPDTLFVIEGWTITEEGILNYQANPELISITGELTTKTRIVKGSHELFLQLCKGDREVHLLQHVEDCSCFKWLEASAGADVAVLREHTMSYPSVDNIQDFVLKYDRPVTIIFGDNGMGKTTYLNHVRRELTAQNENKFILYLDDIKLRTFYTSCSSANVVDFIEFFTVDLTNSDIHIMYDNFERLKERDVIIDIMTKVHSEYRHVKQWITCSDVECRNKLESRLGTFACFLTSVSEESQIKYLKNIWNIEHDELDEYIKSILEHCNTWNLRDNYNYSCSSSTFHFFSEYPLHLKMITTAFSPNYNSGPHDLSILDVYEAFANSIYSNENVEESAVLQLFKCINHEFKFKTKVNLTPKVFDFVNVTNYLAAKWFSNNFHDHPEDLKWLLNSTCTYSFRYFFNSFLCRGKQLHTAALNGRIVTKLCSSSTVIERDVGGRTALHLAEDVGIMRSLIAEGASVDVKDDVLQWTPLQYCDYNGHLKCLNVLLERGADPLQLTWTLSLSEEEISKRLEYASTTDPKSTLYIKFICQKIKQFQVAPKIIEDMFRHLPQDVTMMVLNHVQKSSKHYVNSWGKTALFYAVEHNHFVAVKFLIHNLGFDIHHRCYNRKTVFHLACKMGFTDIAKYLLDLGVDVNVTRGNNTSNAFIDCCKNNNLEVLKFLIENGADVNVISTCGKAPLQLACEHDSTAVVKYLYENAANLNIKYNIDKDNLPYLLCDAVNYAFGELVEFLLFVNQKQLMNINKKFDGKTLLHMACRLFKDHEVSVTSLLIQAGADVNATDDNGCTPVFDLFNNDNSTAVKLLADNGCNLSHVNNDGETVLHVFTKNGLETSCRSEYNYNDLAHLIRELITYGADVNARTPSGDTPLHFACRNSNITVIRCLVSQGADIHAVNDKEETPLHLGCIRECTQCYANFKTIKYLVTKGADVNARTNSDKTPIMYAVSIPSNVRELLNLGADVHCKDKDNKTLVHYFAEYNLLNELKILMRQGIKDAKSIDSAGQTALHLAAKKNHFECLKLLTICFQSDGNIVDNEGKKAVDLADDIVKYCSEDWLILMKYKSSNDCTNVL